MTIEDDRTLPALAESTARIVALAHAAHRRHFGHRRRGPILIGIDGPSGSGKSTLATRVAAALDDAPILRMDDVYPGWEGLAASVPRLVRQVLSPARHGRIPRYRRYDWHLCDYAEWRAIRRHRYLIVEGAGATCGVAREYFAVRVFVDADPDERMRRALQRDGEMFRPHWDRWALQEAALFGPDRTRRAAHVTVITSSEPGRQRQTCAVRPCPPPGA
ncbi:(d)CMP kinase [Rhodococcus hoagii]|nr:(d)CMP kinase [Prescottella equi]